EIPRPLRAGLRIRARPVEQLAHVVEAIVALLLQLVVRRVAGSPEASTPAAATAAAGANGRKVEFDPGVSAKRGFLPGPAVEIHHGDFAAEDPAARHEGRRRHA